ncbi:TIGR03668 family PPOX class F420-dependent oxidoreductase [Nocardia sp. NPDC088792]|uniref:TIGR03668 family PPOX class F420-dependent oxidoreductase n=1 Tax=Nocardia sp. NPDC088792 TaxID=3364332 RepID=UPI0037FA8421
MRLDEGTALERFRSARVARLATVSADGAPHIVPVTFALSVESGEIVIAVDHKPKSTTDLRRLRNIEATGRVSILADEYDEDWTRLWWVRIDGAARVLAPGPACARPIALLAAKYPQYRGNAPEGPVIRIEVDSVRGWSYS